MSEWADRVTKHRVSSDANTVRAAVAKARGVARDTLELESISRVADVERYVTRRLTTSEPHLVPIATLNNVANSLQAIATELNSFAGNLNAGHLTNANNHADAMLIQAQDLPAIATSDDVQGVHDSVVRFRRSVGQHLSRLEKRVGTVATAVEQVETAARERSAEVAEAKGRLDQAIQQFTTSSTEAERKRSGEFADVIADAKTQTAEAINAVREELQAASDDMQEEFRQKKADLSRLGDEMVHALDDLRDQASDLVLCSQSVFRFADFGNDGFGRCRPDEGRRLLVSGVDVSGDCVDQFADAGYCEAL